METGIHTRRMKKITYNSKEHYEKLHEGMSQVNAWVHDGAEQLASIPTINDLRKNLALLNSWREDLKPKKNNNKKTTPEK